MTTSEFVAAVLLKATGKVTNLSASDTKYQKVLGIGNAYIEQWANQYGVDWNSLYDKAYSIGTVTATDAFDLDDDIRKISDTPGDFVQIEDTDGNIHNFNVVPADTLKREPIDRCSCAQIGNSLVFCEPFDADSPLIGGTIYVPVYLHPDPLVNPADEVPVDIPRWLVLMSAAEFVRNDVTKQNQYPNLVAEANQLMERMMDDNDAQINTAYAPWRPLGRTW